MTAAALLRKQDQDQQTSTLRLLSRGLGDKPAISVIGLGYVGAVSMACLANVGFRMIGVDISPARVEAIREGRSPIVEDRLGDLLSDGVEAGLIDATQNLVAAVLGTNVTFMSVGTPTAADGGCDLTYVRHASRAIGQALSMKDEFHVVVLRCSVPPGTTLEVVGREGDDTFVWFKKDIVDANGVSQGVDHLADFGDGDMLDLRDLFKEQTIEHWADVVRLDETPDGKFVIQADFRGQFHDVATIDINLDTWSFEAFGDSLILA